MTAKRDPKDDAVGRVQSDGTVVVHVMKNGVMLSGGIVQSLGFLIETVLGRHRANGSKRQFPLCVGHADAGNVAWKIHGLAVVTDAGIVAAACCCHLTLQLPPR